MPFAYWCVLIAAVMPFVIVVAAKAGADDDNHDPRDGVERLSPQRRRAYAAHLNAFENFPIFAAAVIIAVTQGASLTAVNALAALYVGLRVAHALLYIADRPAARSSVFGLALLVNIAIFVLPVFR